MKYTKLGKSDLNVSKICLGCMGFGGYSVQSSCERKIITINRYNKQAL